MARQLTSNADIDSFISRVILEANHHALGVAQVIKPLSDEVRQRLRLSVDKVEVYEREGKLARTCWVTINSNRYVFTYNYTAKKIELRARSTQGALLYQFDNQASQSDLQKEVAKL